MAEVEILIQSALRRFGVYKGTLFYVDSQRAENLVDGVENLVNTGLGFDANSNSVLIRSNKNIIVDPGHFHMAFYGIMTARLKELGLEPKDIDAVVNTHCHHDHTGANCLFRGKKLYIHQRELDFAREGNTSFSYWKEYVSAFFETLDIQRITPDMEIARDVRIIETPGHSPGSISVLVDTPKGLVAIIGDTAMSRREYQQRDLSRLYSPEAKAAINKSLDLVESLQPKTIILGHDYPIVK